MGENRGLSPYPSWPLFTRYTSPLTITVYTPAYGYLQHRKHLPSLCSSQSFIPWTIPHHTWNHASQQGILLLTYYLEPASPTGPYLLSLSTACTTNLSLSQTFNHHHRPKPPYPQNKARLILTSSSPILLYIYCTCVIHIIKTHQINCGSYDVLLWPVHIIYSFIAELLFLVCEDK